MTMTHFTRKSTMRIAMCVWIIWVSASPPAFAGEDGSNKKSKTAHPTTIAAYAAACFGAGTALVITSACIDGEKEVITGYDVSGDVVRPITTQIGNDTDGLLIAGISCLVLGAMLIFVPILDSYTSEAAHGRAKVTSLRENRLSLDAVAFDRLTTGVGVALSF
jgi:hypothetical protein